MVINFQSTESKRIFFSNENLALDGVELSASILTLIEELRGEIRELRDRVAILEISTGTGESSDPSETFLNPPPAAAAVPTPATTTTTTTTTTSRPVSHITWKLFTVGFLFY